VVRALARLEDAAGPCSVDRVAVARAEVPLDLVRDGVRHGSHNLCAATIPSHSRRAHDLLGRLLIQELPVLSSAVPMARPKRNSFERYLARQLRDPEFASAYLRALNELRSAVPSMVKRRQSSGRPVAPVLSEIVFTERNVGDVPRGKLP
jgi:hypothetical protein